VLREACSLGLRTLVISGGEPTLYEHLIDLVHDASSLGLSVTMNSNGNLIKREYAENLIAAGLNSVRISLYSEAPHVHNKFRQSRKAWEHACETIQMYRELKGTYPNFGLFTQTIILRENFRTLDDLILFHYSLGSESIALSYLEGDFQKRYLLKASEIKLLCTEVMPRILELCATLHRSVRREALNEAKKIYSSTYGSLEDFSEGRYWKLGFCAIPRIFALILANGDVHPCNIIEYIGEPTMGNLFEKNLAEIWSSTRWENFRKNLLEECVLCPMNLHVRIPLRKGGATWGLRRRFVEWLKAP
jgi:MoaA/NifB/PqqE/SkfB family radical SAM enzyme